MSIYQVFLQGTAVGFLKEEIEADRVRIRRKPVPCVTFIREEEIVAEFSLDKIYGYKKMEQIVVRRIENVQKHTDEEEK